MLDENGGSTWTFFPTSTTQESRTSPTLITKGLSTAPAITVSRPTVSPSHTQDYRISKSLTTSTCTTGPTVTVPSVAMDVDHLGGNSGFTRQHIIIVGCVGGGLILFSLLLVTVCVFFGKRRREKNGRFQRRTYRFSISAKRVENVEDDLTTSFGGTEDRGAGSLNASLSCQTAKGKYEVPFTALEVGERIEMGAFVTVHKAVLRNLHYPHRPPLTCVVNLLKGEVAIP